jgi:putative SOS response-associated peptidase YedK
VILYPEDEQSWLNPSFNTRSSLEVFLHPYENEGLDLFEVSMDVNLTKNNDDKLIYPLNSK